MKILVIMLYWYPYEGPLMPVYGAVFRDLIAKGHKITILTSFPHYREGRPEIWSEYRNKLFEITTWEDVKVIRTYVFSPVFKSCTFSLLYRALNFISFNVSCLIAGMLITGKQDLIFAPSSPPLTNGLCANIIGFFKKIPFIYNVQDLYPDMAVKLGILKRKFIIRFLRKIEEYVYRKAARVLVISRAMEKNLLKKNVSRQKIEIISNFIDTSFINPLPKENDFSTKYKLNNKFVVMYAGNIGIPHGIEFVIEAAELLAKNKDIIFTFVSRGEHKNKIVKLSKTKKLKNVLFLPQQPENIVPKIWASADVSLVTTRKWLSEDSVPSKTYSIMASGRPIIAMVDESSEVWNLVKDSRGGIYVPSERPELLVDAILRLYGNKAERLIMGKNGRKYAESNFSREVISQKYESIFLDVVSP